MVTSVHVEPDLFHQVTDGGHPAAGHMTVNGTRAVIGVSGARSHMERSVRRPTDGYRKHTRMVDLLSAVGQRVGVKQVSENIWLVSFMHYDLGYFDHETCRLEPIENPFSPKVLLIPPE